MSYRVFCDKCDDRIKAVEDNGVRRVQYVKMWVYDTDNRPTSSDLHIECAALAVPKWHKALMDDEVSKVEMRKEWLYQ